MRRHLIRNKLLFGWCAATLAARHAINVCDGNASLDDESRRTGLTKRQDVGLYGLGSISARSFRAGLYAVVTQSL